MRAFDKALDEVLNKESEAPIENKLQVSIYRESGFIFIRYNMPIQLMKITRTQAKEMARRLIQEAL